MIAPPSRTSAIMGLLEAVDEQTALLQRRLEEMEALALAIVSRDEAQMTALFDRMTAALPLQEKAQQRLAGARSIVAATLGWETQEVRLGRLLRETEGDLHRAIDERRRLAMQTVERFRRQHERTSLLLLECARVNRMLLEAILPDSRGLDTYGGRGVVPWRPRAGLMSTER